ncbi:phosphatidylethanolamine-binding protein [Mycena filopes]|nr:phosphatidylethanolamine-binding protein [Mycena filopes]
MFSSVVYALPFLAGSTLASAVSSTSLTNISTAFSKAGIVPGVIPVFQPSAILDVVFATVNVTLASNLTIQQTADEPKFILTSDNSTAVNDEYLVALFDPDAPTPQNTSLAQFRHFLGGGYTWNVSNGSNTGVLTNTTAPLTDYFGPGPPAGSDPHRYLVLAFVQPKGFDTAALSIVNSSTPRTNFNVTAFSDALGLGAPFAGTFFFVGPDAPTASGSSPPGSSTGASSPSGAIPVHIPMFLAALSAVVSLVSAF